MSKRPKQPKSRELRETATRPAPSTPDAAAEVAAAAFERTYLPESIAVLLLCLTPVALVPIYYGLAVRRASAANHLTEAKAASELARIWFIFSVCFGVTANIALLGAYLISQKD